MSELKKLIGEILNSKGIDEECVDTFILWYLHLGKPEEKGFEKEFLDNLKNAYREHDWANSFRAMRFGAVFLNKDVSHFNRFEDLILKHGSPVDSPEL